MCAFNWVIRLNGLLLVFQVFQLLCSNCCLSFHFCFACFSDEKKGSEGGPGMRRVCQKMRSAVARILRASKSLHNLSQINPRAKNNGLPSTFFGDAGIEFSTLAGGRVGAESSVLQVLRDEIRNLKSSRKVNLYIRKTLTLIAQSIDHIKHI